VFGLLEQLGQDEQMCRLFDEQHTIQGWLDVEAALTRGLAVAGVVDTAQCRRIVAACTLDAVDVPRLWAESAVVGYPILPLIKMICAALTDDDAGFVHFGATTQDIMDTALAVQLRDATGRLIELTQTLGDEVARLVEYHAHVVMPGRTHAQQAVPTTFGAKCATFLDQLTRDRERLFVARTRIAFVSLFGAGGTSAALNSRASIVRSEMAAALGLAVTSQPWHVARDRVAEVAQVAALVAATCVRLGREVVDLSRTELGEVAEQDGQYRGASSTMPQKANPISAEMAVGFGVMAQAAGTAVLRAMEAGHERAAGEWQIEWQAVPLACQSAAGALRAALDSATGLRVFPERMQANLALDGGRIMAEAYMIALAARVGRDKAHETMYRAVRDSRRHGQSLLSTLESSFDADEWRALRPHLPTPDEYLGDTARICADAVAAWRHGGVIG